MIVTGRVDSQAFQVSSCKLLRCRGTVHIFNRKNDSICKIDLKDAYFCIAIHQIYRKFLRYNRWGQLLQYTSLPFGLAAGSRLFTKIMKPIIPFLRRMGIRLIIYLDDILLLNQSKEGLMKNRDSLLWLLHNLGG